MVGKMQVGGVTLDVAVVNINDDITLEPPDAILKIELACASYIGLNANVSLRQSEASKHQHRTLAVVARRIGVE